MLRDAAVATEHNQASWHGRGGVIGVVPPATVHLVKPRAVLTIMYIDRPAGRGDIGSRRRTLAAVATAPARKVRLHRSPAHLRIC